MSYSNSTPSMFAGSVEGAGEGGSPTAAADQADLRLVADSYYQTTANDYQKPCLASRMFERAIVVSHQCLLYLQRKFNEHTVTSLASISILIILVPIICCFLASLMREEERRIKEQYKKLSRTSSQSFIVGLGTSSSSCGGGGGGSIGGALEDAKKVNSLVNSIEHRSVTIPHSSSRPQTTTTTIRTAAAAAAYQGGATLASASQRTDNQKLQVFELRRETYFGLVRLLKPGCRTIVLLCDAHSRSKLLARFNQYIYPYRKNKSLQFAFLLIEKNINWYRDLLKSTLLVERELQINPMNCIGTVLVFNGFKKHFSIYHASESKYDPDEPLFLLEESLLDNFPSWLERFFAGKVARNYVKYWPDRMR